MALSSEIPQELKDLLSWNPPQLYPRLLPAKTMSTKTSEPTFFDRHVSERLKLLHVKRLPTLVHDIAAIVDGITANGVQFPSSLFYSAAIFNHLVNRLDCTVVDENEVASFYDKTTATFCIQAASILALGVPNLLRWSLLGNVSGHAIADGFLYFADPTTSAGVYSKLEVTMGKEIADLVRLLAKRRSALTTQEFKNLAAGERDVMLAIPRLSTLPKFNWNNCDVPDCAMMTSHENNRVVEVEAIMGHDAKTTPWTFPRHSNNSMFPGVQGSESSENVATSKGLKRKRDEDSGDKGRANLSLAPKASYAPVIPLLTTPQGHGPRRSARVAARVQNPDGGTNVTQSIPPPPLPVGVVQVAKGKEKAQDEDGDDGDGNSEDADDKLNPSYKDNHDLSALNIVQQAWAQATREDNSIIVLQSGNHEFIGIRHRASQTLYVSDLIEPHACREPSYGKLHLGIYIAAVSDAIERASQGAASGDGPSGGMRGGGPSDGRDNHNGSTRSSGSVMLRAAHETTKSTLEFASGCNVMLLYLQYDIYNSPAPSTFVRSDPTGQAPILPSQETVRNYQLEECLTIVLTSEIDCSATGEVLRGTLEVEESALLDVVVKLALASEQRDALRKEYHIYHLLEKSAVTTGITTPLGLFEDVEGSACALVMPYVGIPLAKMPDFHLPISHRDAILATLKKIHQAGILHHDLSLNNILVADSGLTIIDFGQSQVCHDQGKKNHEYLQLQSLLVQYAKQSRQKKS